MIDVQDVHADMTTDCHGIRSILLSHHGFSHILHLTCDYQPQFHLTFNRGMPIFSLLQTMSLFLLIFENKSKILSQSPALSLKMAMYCILIQIHRA